jgi:hypothetical protein
MLGAVIMNHRSAQAINLATHDRNIKLISDFIDEKICDCRTENNTKNKHTKNPKNYLIVSVMQ